MRSVPFEVFMAINGMRHLLRIQDTIYLLGQMRLPNRILQSNQIARNGENQTVDRLRWSAPICK